MKREMYLECPQCRARGFYTENGKGERVFFYINYDKKPLNYKDNNYDIEGVDLTNLSCVSCSWSGGVNKLKEVTDS